MRYILSYAMDFMKLYVIETGIFGYRVKKGCKPLILSNAIEMFGSAKLTIYSLFRLP